MTSKRRRRVWRAAGFVGAALAAGAGVFVASYPRWRNWCLSWGATDEEVERPFIGDDLLPHPNIASTRAVSISAPPEAVWPWLAQMGSGRGGLYTYDWIENLFGLQMHSVGVVLPEFQSVEVGDAQTLGKNGPTLRVAVCEKDRSLVFRSDDGNWLWAFVLEPEGSGTKLLSRNRIAIPGASVPARWAYRYIMEPGSLIMERKMLLGIKERAERVASDGADLTADGAVRPDAPQS